ncbi:hypothetical protein ACVW1A_004361 [Bradyrhizobium sp. LB1.3]
MRQFRRRERPLTKNSFLTMSSVAAIVAVSLAVSAPVRAADDAAIQKWIAEFQPSTLSKDEQKKELEWFVKAAEPFKGMEINVVSETITTHEYESQTLAKAFSELTGIKLKHDIIQEGDVVEKLQTQMQSGKNVYDGWINDSDLIGTHFRYGQTIALSDYMTGEGKDVTDPQLDVNDFIGKSFGNGPGWQALSAARPAVREPLLVPLRLVHQRRLQGQVQGQVWLRTRRARELVRLRGHRRVLHERHQGDQRRQGLRPYGLWQEGPVAWLAVHRRLAVDGR